MQHGRSTARWLQAAALLASIGTAGSAPATPFHNTTNVAFNSRCNGPQGAVVVEEWEYAFHTAGVGYAVSTQHEPARLASAVATLKKLKAAGLVPRSARLRFPRTVVHTRNGRLVQPDLMQTAQDGGLGAATNDIRFIFEGWSAGDQAALESYLATAMPKARLIYGPPAFDLTVKVIQDSTLQELQGGIYDAAANEIRLPPLSGNFPEDTYVLLMLVLNAFHDDAILFYDAWEQGMIGAAAYAIQTQPGVSPGYDPIDPGPFYALSVYECQNLPELGNSTFYPSSGTTNMLVWRIAMARAAWLKCWIEDPAFFAEFNQRYYANFTTTLPGDVPSLKELAAQALPVVEGLPFAEWYERQYVLDTSVRTGPKLYTWNIPLTQSVALICELYETLPDGDETPFGGQARTVYWNDTFDIQLYAEEGNIIDIPPGGTTPGEGFLLPTFYNIGGPQRVTVQIDVAGLRRYYPFAYGMRGFDPGENNIYGAILGMDDGSLAVQSSTAELTDVPVERGVWGDRLTTGVLTPRQVAITFTSGSGDAVTRRFNIGWDSYCCFIEAGPQATLTHTFEYGINGLHLMSLPLLPLNPDASAVLGISPERLLMAWWDPLQAAENKYRLWPSFPFKNPGQGYWLRVADDTTVILEGVEPDPARDYELPLAPGWNLIGSPRRSTVTLTDLQVREGDAAPLYWSEAVVQRLVQDSLFAYDQTAGYKLESSLSPWAGYWVRCLAPSGAALIFPANTATAAARSLGTPGTMQTASQHTSTRPEVTWRLPLVVSAGPLRSEAAWLGCGPTALDGPDHLDLVAPPGVDDYAQVRFPHTDWGAQSGEYLTDVRSLGAHGHRWDFEVSCSLPRTLVTLSWPQVSSLPRGIDPVLLDPATGRRSRMKAMPHYRFRTGAQGGRRRLAIETGTVPLSLTISGLSARSVGPMATFTYALSLPACVDIEVRDSRGALVRVLAAGHTRSAGRHVVSWNTRDARGKAVRNGTYRVLISARDQQGSAARAAHTFTVRRWL
ncbi:MAG: hypothetical protein HPY69_02285 [Armatimonadetes bacterium]|nr:hypothetical protein [Armatimonadota bacterium]